MYFGDIYGRQFIVYIESLPSHPSSSLGHLAMPAGQTSSNLTQSLHPLSDSSPPHSSRQPVLRVRAKWPAPRVSAAIHHPRLGIELWLGSCISQAPAVRAQGSLCTDTGHSANAGHCRGLHHPHLLLRRCLALCFEASDAYCFGLEGSQ